ncbi:MAG: hypothetical protein K6E27_08380 [Eubacterium sp.]|nr:hypothetical protein [Eubacterium sp.]
MNRNVSIIKDIDNKDIVVINDILFKGRRGIKWDEIKAYLKRFVGDTYIITETDDEINIGADFPNEYTGSIYTYRLKGAVAKAKANVAQGIPELIEIAVGGNHRDNKEAKHFRNARYGWYRFDSRFAMPVYYENGMIERYNVFHVSLIIRHAEDGKMYLYDIIDIKKETGNPLEP